MSNIVAIISDVHFHDWSHFSTVENGVNSRLQETIDEVEAVGQEILARGGHTIICAGDLFHVRGNLKPSVLNPVIDLFRRLSGMGIQFVTIPGNHDLEGDHSHRVSNAITALEGLGAKVAHQPMSFGPFALFPWYPNRDLLTEAMLKFSEENPDCKYAIIHAPVEGVLPHLRGFKASELMVGRFERVFCGHYHNHVEVEPGFFSVGALSHQTFGDIGSLAGHIFFDTKTGEVEHVESNGPKFVRLTGGEDEDLFDQMVAGNFVTLDCAPGSLEEHDKLKQALKDKGARDVKLRIRPDNAPERAKSGEPVKAVGSLNEEISDYVRAEQMPDEVAAICHRAIGEVG